MVKIKKKLKGFTQGFENSLFPIIYLLVWIFSKTKRKRKVTVCFPKLVPRAKFWGLIWGLNVQNFVN